MSIGCRNRKTNFFLDKMLTIRCQKVVDFGHRRLSDHPFPTMKAISSSFRCLFDYPGLCQAMLVELEVTFDVHRHWTPRKRLGNVDSNNIPVRNGWSKRYRNGIDSMKFLSKRFEIDIVSAPHFSQGWPWQQCDRGYLDAKV